MGVLLALAIFVLTLRFIGNVGTSPLWSLGIAVLVTFLLYPVIAAYLDSFFSALVSGGVSSVLAGVVVVGCIAFASYAIGRRTSGSGGDPFKPF